MLPCIAHGQEYAYFFTDPDVGRMEVRIEPENRCSEYDSTHYGYSEAGRQFRAQAEEWWPNGVPCFYTQREYADISEMVISHWVPLSEAHDSGLCSASVEERGRFASDSLSFVLVDPAAHMERAGRDPAEWLPTPWREGETWVEFWYVLNVARTKVEYELSIDQAEWEAIKEVWQRMGYLATRDPRDYPSGITPVAWGQLKEAAQ